MVFFAEGENVEVKMILDKCYCSETLVNRAKQCLVNNNRDICQKMDISIY